MLKPYKRAQLQFEQVREIGSDGRNSTTWVVNDVQLGAEIVMKTIAKNTLRSVTDFFDQAKALYATAHQNVVQIHYACEDRENVFVAMPLYRRGSVKGMMAAGHLTTREVVRLGCQVLSGLHNIHSKGLIHFDIKPDNILLSNRGEALLADFGLAKQMQLGMARPNGLYVRMAPPGSHDGTTVRPPFRHIPDRPHPLSDDGRKRCVRSAVLEVRRSVGGHRPDPTCPRDTGRFVPGQAGVRRTRSTNTFHPGCAA